MVLRMVLDRAPFLADCHGIYSRNTHVNVGIGKGR